MKCPHPPPGEGIAPHNGSTKTAAVPILPKEKFSSAPSCPSFSRAFGATDGSGIARRAGAQTCNLNEPSFSVQKAKWSILLREKGADEPLRRRYAQPRG